MKRLAVTALALFALASLPALAADEVPNRVGRVNYIQGQLGFHGKTETQWSAATVNYPVATGGAFWTDPKSRAEIRIGAQTVDLASNTELDIVELTKQVMQFAVPQGRIGLHVRSLPEGNSVEIDIPRGGLWLLQPGIYDIDGGDPDHPARIMVFEGGARFVGGTLDVGIKAGEAAVISGTTTLTVAMERAAPDAFVQWCRSRDYKEQNLASPYHVSPRMTGYEELDTYGRWRTVGDYGPVWYPNTVPTGWAPYRYGRWSWFDPWGWTWIDEAPWGFAPFHYGRWAFIDGYWGWAPGAYADYPVYAPALVGWLGDPAALVLAAAVGPLVGWFPLGPGEAYWPGFTSDRGFVRGVNSGVDPARLTSPAAATNQTFANRGAATVVPQRSLATTAPVNRAALPVSGAAAQTAAVTTQAPAPTAARTAGTTTTGTTATGAPAARTGAAVAAAGGLAGATVAATHGTRPTGTTAATAGTSGWRGGSAAVGGRTATRGVAGPAARAPGVAGSRFAGRGGVAHAAAPRFAGPRGGGAMPAYRGGGGPRGGMAAFRGGGGGPHFSGGGGGAVPHVGGGGGSGPHGGGGAPHLGGGGGGGGHGGKGHG